MSFKPLCLTIVELRHQVHIDSINSMRWPTQQARNKKRKITVQHCKVGIIVCICNEWTWLLPNLYIIQPIHKKGVSNIYTWIQFFASSWDLLFIISNASKVKNVPKINDNLLYKALIYADARLSCQYAYHFPQDITDYWKWSLSRYMRATNAARGVSRDQLCFPAEWAPSEQNKTVFGTSHEIRCSNLETMEAEKCPWQHLCRRWEDICKYIRRSWMRSKLFCGAVLTHSSLALHGR